MPGNNTPQCFWGKRVCGGEDVGGRKSFPSPTNQEPRVWRQSGVHPGYSTRCAECCGLPWLAVLFRFDGELRNGCLNAEETLTRQKGCVRRLHGHRDEETREKDHASIDRTEAVAVVFWLHQDSEASDVRVQQHATMGRWEMYMPTCSCARLTSVSHHPDHCCCFEFRRLNARSKTCQVNYPSSKRRNR